MLDIRAARSFESRGSVLDFVPSSYAAAAPLIHGLRAIFWASGLGGIAVAGVMAGALALDAQPVRPERATTVERGWRYVSKGSDAGFADISSTPKIIIATEAVPEGKVVSPPLFDISLYNDPDYLRNIEQLYNPWAP